MQLMIVSFVLFFLVLTQDLKAQLNKITTDKQNDLIKGDSTERNISNYSVPDWQTIDLDFLSSYYMQDGNNAAVTGGIGTEQLTDFTQKLILSVPLSPKLKLNLDGGYDYYSSASTDNIDNIRSSESSSDVRGHGNIGLTYSLSDTKKLGFRLGGSAEYDYFSVNGGLNLSLLSKDQNTGLDFGLQVFKDTWYPIYPIELEESAKVATDKRDSYNASLTFSRVLTRKLQMSLQVEGIYMDGLLSTPFHRVYFKEQDQARIENLPNKRLKVPIALRLNAHVSEWMILRTYYRYYWDNWGVKGHTASIEVPLKINRFLSIAPFYRFHTQTAAEYFKPYKAHSIQDDYYTSDYDLSSLSSHAFGVGISYSPANGITKVNLPFKNRPVFMLKSIDLKYSHFNRSTGLNANIISLGLSFSF